MIAPTGRSIFRLSTATCGNHAVDVRYLALQRVSAIFAAHATSSRPISSQQTSSSLSYRHYATTTTKAVARPKAHTGRTTSTAKRPAAKKLAAKKPATSTVKKTTTTTVKNTPAKPKAKSSTKKKAKPKKRAKAKKPVKRNVKRKPKKVLTEKEAKNKTIRELKAKALKLPKQLPASAWLAFWLDYLKENEKGGEGVAVTSKEAGLKFKNIIPEEREVCDINPPGLRFPNPPMEKGQCIFPRLLLRLLTSFSSPKHWNHVANQNKAANKTAYKNFIESYPVERVNQARVAGQRLRRLGVQGRYDNKLPDERRVKRPASSKAFFYQERMLSGDFRGIGGADAFKRIYEEFSQLSAAEKEVS